MVRRLTPRFAVYVALVLLALGLVQLVASLAFYQAIDRQTLKDDHARRVAELLVVSDRIHALAPGGTGALMSTRHLQARVVARPSVRADDPGEALTGIAERIVEWEPTLADRSLRLDTVSGGHGRRDLVGSIRLADGHWLDFRSHDITSMWPVAFRATLLTLATTLACLVLGLLVLRVLARPLRAMTQAARAIGQGRDPVPLAEEGAQDLVELAHAMNAMQARIARLLKDQARTFEAISHDLRTPLSRQKVVADLLEDEELAALLHGSVGEMDDLLTSLQDFLRAQHVTAEAETVALGPFLSETLRGFGDAVTVEAEEAPVLRTYREPLARAMLALADNAVRFGGHARVRVEQVGKRWTIAVADSGPGIPAAAFEAVLDPFVRLDEARGRDTAGFGLGIPTAHRLMTRFGGDLHFAEAPGGGLIARLTVPEAQTAA